MRSPAMRAARWTLVNAAFGFVIVRALLYGDIWARNLTVFAAWVSLAASLLMAVAAVSVRTDLRQGREPPIGPGTFRGRSVPNWLNALCDASICTALVGAGWFLTAVVYLIAALLESTYHSVAHDIRNESPDVKAVA